MIVTRSRFAQDFLIQRIIITVRTTIIAPRFVSRANIIGVFFFSSETREKRLNRSFGVRVIINGTHCGKKKKRKRKSYLAKDVPCYSFYSFYNGNLGSTYWFILHSGLEYTKYTDDRTNAVFFEMTFSVRQSRALRRYLPVVSLSTRAPPFPHAVHAPDTRAVWSQRFVCDGRWIETIVSNTALTATSCWSAWRG